MRGVISLTGQYAAVDEEQTGRENLVMIARLRRFARPAARATGCRRCWSGSTWSTRADRRVRTYSGGMRRRLDLAMSLVAQPRLLFLDEPTTGLDPVSRTTMWDAIGDLVRDGVTIFLTTQYLEEADRLADRIVVLHNGGVVADGTADALKNSVGGTRLDLTFSCAEDAFARTRRGRRRGRRGDAERAVRRQRRSSAPRAGRPAGGAGAACRGCPRTARPWTTSSPR